MASVGWLGAHVNREQGDNGCGYVDDTFQSVRIKRNAAGQIIGKILEGENDCPDHHTPNCKSFRPVHRSWSFCLSDPQGWHISGGAPVSAVCWRCSPVLPEYAGRTSPLIRTAWAQKLSIDEWFFRSMRAFPMPALKSIDALRRGARTMPTC